jgi:hypothetical protein
MRISIGFLLVFVLIQLCACREDEKALDPLVGKWERNFYQFKNLPPSHKNFENLMLPSPYVPGTSGIYDDDSYDLIFNADGTFEREVIFNDRQSISTDDGTWTVEGTQLILNSDESSMNEVFVINSNSGTAIALLKNQRWLLLPDVVWDTVSQEYYEANTAMLYNEYGQLVDLQMYYFFNASSSVASIAPGIYVSSRLGEIQTLL